MESAPTTTPDQDIDADEDEPSWTDFFPAVGPLLLAIVPFTPLWEQVAVEDSTRRKYGALSRFLADVGPVPVSLTFAAIGVAVVVWVLVQRSGRKSAA